MKATKSGRFKLTPVNVTEKGFTYQTFRVSGWLNGRRIRKQFKNRDEAVGEKLALEVEAANVGGEVRARNTRLSVEQLAEAESAFLRLAGKPLLLAVEWFLANYRPPVTQMALDRAVTSFLEDRAAHVRPIVLRDYRNTLDSLKEAFPERTLDRISTGDIQRYLASRRVGKKRHNNLRGDLHSFFAYAQSAPREWVSANPVKPIPVFKIARGLPEIITTDTAAKLMAYVETYAGNPGSNAAAGCLVPYFALTLFAGLRPSLPDGEICKLAAAPDLGRHIDVVMRVIRISPEIAKTKSIRQVKIRPNLAAWLTRYPTSKLPIRPRNAQRMIQHVREKFALTDDVLRHTFISMHVAAFKSLGEAALEAGNSESIIRRHYLNLVGESDAAAFWEIKPARARFSRVDEAEQRRSDV